MSPHLLSDDFTDNLDWPYVESEGYSFGLRIDNHYVRYILYA